MTIDEPSPTGDSQSEQRTCTASQPPTTNKKVELTTLNEDTTINGSTDDPERDEKIDEYLEKRSELSMQLFRLFAVTSRRNLSLARIIYLRMISYGQPPLEFSRPDILGPREYQGKRGKKEAEVTPLKMIMSILHCSRRSAQDYQRVMRAEALSDRIFNLDIANMSLMAHRDTHSLGVDGEDRAR